MQVFRSASCFLVALSVSSSVSVSVSVSVSATQDHDNERNHLRQPRHLNPVAETGTPTNCQANDFELPTTLVGAWTAAKMPPFITTEIFAMIVGMKDGWTPGFTKTETPIVARLVHLIDTLHWNCAAAYSSTWLDGLTHEDPLVRSPKSFFVHPVSSQGASAGASTAGASTAGASVSTTSNGLFAFSTSSTASASASASASAASTTSSSGSGSGLFTISTSSGDHRRRLMPQEIIMHASTPRLLCMVHAWAAVVEDWHPEANTTLANVLSAFQYQDVSFGYNAEVEVGFHAETGEANKNVLLEIAAENCYKPKIMGAIVAKQLTEYGRRDGYNMYGDLARDGSKCTHNCRRYTDSTGYESGMNKDINAKFRWQPMLEDNGRGYFTEQQFVTPHIGTTAKRAILSEYDFTSRLAQGVTYNKPHKDHKVEARKVAERLRLTATDDVRKAKIEFYDNKIAVTFAILGSVAAYGPTFEQIVNFSFGLTASEYDSILVAWKEKVTHDRIRPTTWIQNKMAEEDFVTYGGPYQGVQTIKGKEFESWSRVMPHSEYISGSACICQSLKDYTDEWMDRSVTVNNKGVFLHKLPGYEGAPVFSPGSSIAVAIATDQTGRAAPFRAGSSSTEPGKTPATDLTLVVESMTELRDQCGQSRLDGGMHFAQAVEHAYPLCEGIGQQAADYSVTLLGSGGWEDVRFGFCERRFFTDNQNACSATPDPITGGIPKDCTHAAGCPADVADGTYPDLTNRNSYCVCKSGVAATYTRCEASPTADYKYDAFASTLRPGNAYLTTATDDVALGCGGYAGTVNTGLCVPKDDVSLQGRNNLSYQDPTEIICPFYQLSF